MVLSSTVANVATPQVMGAVGVGLDQTQWMATAFITAMVVSQLLNHWIVEAFAQRKAFSLTIGVFLFGSALGFSAPNIELLILARVLQGFAAGVTQPLVMITIFRVFPPERRGFAMGIYGSAILIAPGIGPTVGGLAIDAIDWRVTFLFPLPFCLVALVGGLFVMPSATVTTPRHLLIGWDTVCCRLACCC